MAYTELEIDGKIYDFNAYPVGSIYMSVNSTSPASIFGGTWERLKDRFLLGAGGSYSVESTGGSKTTTIEDSNLPATRLAMAKNITGATVSLNNSVPWGTNSVPANAYGMTQYTNLNKLGQTARYSATPLDVTPPYLAVYMWKRTA